MFQLLTLLSIGALDIHSEMNGSGFLMLAFIWMPNRLKSYYNKYKCNSKWLLQGMHSYCVFQFLLFHSFFPISPTSLFTSKTMPTVVNSASNKYRLKRPVLRSIGLFSLPLGPHKSRQVKPTPPYPSFLYAFPLHFKIFIPGHSPSFETA